jgi:hypothetical protein
MGRIRTVKPELFKHEELFQLEQETKLPIRISFAGLFTVADREGRFRWKPNVLKLDVLPYDKIDFSRVLDALATHGFVEKYEHNKNIYGVIPSFTIHQVINNRESDSILPDIFDASSTRLSLAQGEGKGREGKGKGREGEEDRVRIRDFWNEWAKKNSMSAIASLTGKRVDKIRSRMKEPMFEIEKILEAAEKSKFILAGKWFNFDWLIDNDTNYVKVLEGKYSDAGANQQSQTGNNWD